MAIQNPNYLNVKVSSEANWTDVKKALGEVQKATGPSFASGLSLDWYNTGKVDSGDWLSFGVSADKVRLVQASFPTFYRSPDGAFPVDCPLLPAELVPGGSLPP